MERRARHARRHHRHRVARRTTSIRCSPRSSATARSCCSAARRRRTRRRARSRSSCGASAWPARSSAGCPRRRRCSTSAREHGIGADIEVIPIDAHRGRLRAHAARRREVPLRHRHGDARRGRDGGLTVARRTESLGGRRSAAAPAASFRVARCAALVYRPRVHTGSPPADDSEHATPAGAALRLRTDVVVIGAGQAGLSTAYHLQRLGLAPVRGFVVLDQSPAPGGAWQFRWPSLTLSTVNRIHDLPGMRFADVVDPGATDVPRGRRGAALLRRVRAARSRCPCIGPSRCTVVCDRGERLRRRDRPRRGLGARHHQRDGHVGEAVRARGIRARTRFRGRQLHTKDYRTADEFAGQHVVVVGAGISAIQLLDEISRVTTTTWVTRRPPEFRDAARSTRRPGAPRWRCVEERVRARAAAGVGGVGHRPPAHAGDRRDARARGARAAADVQRDHRGRRALARRHRRCAPT